MNQEEFTTKDILEMKLGDISDVLQKTYLENGAESASLELTATFPDTGKRMMLQVCLKEIPEEEDSEE